MKKVPKKVLKDVLDTFSEEELPNIPVQNYDCELAIDDI